MQIGQCFFADDVLFDVEGHCWVRRAGDDFIVGVDTVLAWISGALRQVMVRPAGSKVETGKMLASVEGPRHFDILRSPFECTVILANPDVGTNPRLVNKDPYGTGWIARIHTDDLAGLQRLMTAEKARPFYESKLAELSVRCFKEFPDFELYEIGTECSAVLSKLNDLLEKEETGTVIHIVSDDPSAEVEMTRWSDQTGNTLVEARTEGNLRHYIVRKT